VPDRERCDYHENPKEMPGRLMPLNRLLPDSALRNATPLAKSR
jgi:hypothetical protein